VNSIKFKKVSIKNFLSVGDEELILTFKDGVNLITGENKDNESRNGVGKTTILESIYWCLFGNTIRDIKKDKIIHNQSKGNCKVSLNFNLNEDEYKITRSLEPSKLFLIKNNQDITLSTIPKTEELIRELINANEEVFQNAVIMTANNTIPFMAQKKIDKRKFIEGILNLSIFGEMLLKIRSDYNDLKKENDLKGKDLLNFQKNLEIFVKQKEKFEKDKKEKIERIKEKIIDCEKKLEDFKNKNNLEVKDIEENIKNLEEEIGKIEKGIKTIYSNLKDKIENKNKIKFSLDNYIKNKNAFSKKGSKCPTCHREYDDVDHIKKELKDLEDKITSSQKEYDSAVFLEKKETDKIDNLNKALEIKNKSLKDKMKELNDLSLHEEKVKNLKERIEEEQKELQSAEKESFDNQNIAETQKKIQKIEKEISELQKKLLILENCKFIVSEEGVKTFIIKKIITLLNSQLNYYLKALDAPCTCEFNEFFEETIYNLEGKESSYFNFSGGERKRIDIAILFMFQDILKLQTGTHFNFSIYDELFDSALDEKGIAKILDLLKERTQKYSESVYIISHNKSASLENFDDVIKLQKIKGKTFMIS